MSLRHAILGSLAKAPASGYDLLKRFDRTLNHIWWASHGAVYTELQRLEQEGLVHASGSGTRGRVEHTPTEAGLQAMVDWLGSAPARRPRDELMLRVFSLWLLPWRDAAAFFDGLAATYADRLAEYERRAAADGPPDPARPAAFYDAIALRAGVAHERAMMEWAREAAATVREHRPARPASPE